jgi:hypothetical protein
MSFIGKHGFFGALKPADPHYARYALDPAYAKFVDKYARGGGSENAVGTLGRAFAYRRPKLDDGGSVEEWARGGNITAGNQSEAYNPYDDVPENNPENDHHAGHTVARGGGDCSWGPVPSDWDNNGAEIMPTGHNETKSRKRAEGGAVERRHPYYTAPVEPKEQARKIHVEPQDHEGLVTINILQEMPTTARLVHGRVIGVMGAHGAAAGYGPQAHLARQCL